MAIIAQNSVLLKNNQTCIIRTSEAKDAKGLIDLTLLVSQTSPYLTLTPNEVNKTRWKMKSQLNQAIKDPIQLRILAEVDGKIVASLNTFGHIRQRMRHAIDFGIGIIPDYQAQGLGYILISQLLSWAKANPTIKRVGLDVDARNKAAIGLYKKLGFIEEGYHKRTVLYEDGTFADGITMAQLV